MRQMRRDGRVRSRPRDEAGRIAVQLSDAAARGDFSAAIVPGIGFDVLRHVIVQVDGRTREALAQRFADRTDIPRDLALVLANDGIDVAHPILTRSPVLRDGDLIALIHDHGHDHHLAIADRPSLAPSVTEILVELADDDVVQRVVDNEGARFFGHTMQRLVVMAQDTGALRASLSARRSFSQPEQGMAASTAPSPGSAVMRPLVNALRDRDPAGVEKAIVEMTGLPAFAVARILSNPGPEPLAVVCRALDLPKPVFSAAYLRLHGVRPYTVFQQTPAFRNALIYFNRLQANQARALLDTWRRAPITIWRGANQA